MRIINQKIENQLTNLITKTTDSSCPSLKNRMLEKLSNLAAFFTLSTILDGFVYTTPEQQRQQESKLTELANLVAFIIDAGANDQGIQKAYADAWKYSKSRSFKETTITEDRIKQLEELGEDREEILKSLAIANESGAIRFEAMSTILATNEETIKTALVRHFNQAQNASGSLSSLPTWLAKSIANKIEDTTMRHKDFLRNGVLKGITTSGNDLYIINHEIMPLDAIRVVKDCEALEAENSEPGADDDTLDW